MNQNSAATTDASLATPDSDPALAPYLVRADRYLAPDDEADARRTLLATVDRALAAIAGGDVSAEVDDDGAVEGRTLTVGMPDGGEVVLWGYKGKGYGWQVDVLIHDETAGCIHVLIDVAETKRPTPLLPRPRSDDPAPVTAALRVVRTHVVAADAPTRPDIPTEGALTDEARLLACACVAGTRKVEVVHPAPWGASRVRGGGRPVDRRRRGAMDAACLFPGTALEVRVDLRNGNATIGRISNFVDPPDPMERLRILAAHAARRGADGPA